MKRITINSNKLFYIFVTIGITILFSIGVVNAQTVDNEICSDDTLEGSCSLNKPKYCKQVQCFTTPCPPLLIDNCQICGCPLNQICQSDGGCESSELDIIITSPVECGEFYYESIIVSGVGNGAPEEVIIKTESTEYGGPGINYTNIIDAQIIYGGLGFSFEAELPLIIGPNKITAMALYDSMGEVSKPVNVMYVISPTISMFPPYNNSVIGPSPCNVGTAGFAQIKTIKPGETILPLVTINGIEASVVELQTYAPRIPGESCWGAHADIPLEEGRNNIVAIVTDQYNQTASITKNVWLLTIHIDSPDDGEIVNTSLIIVSGGGSGIAEKVMVSVNGIQAEVTIYENSSDFYKFEVSTISLLPGENEIIAIARGSTPEDIVSDSILITYCAGCFYQEENCLPVGFRTATQYCSVDRILKDQLPEGALCNNDCECQSNSCIDGNCVELGFFKKLIRWIQKLF